MHKPYFTFECLFAYFHISDRVNCGKTLLHSLGMQSDSSSRLCKRFAFLKECSPHFSAKPTLEKQWDVWQVKQVDWPFILPPVPTLTTSQNVLLNKQGNVLEVNGLMTSQNVLFKQGNGSEWWLSADSRSNRVGLGVLSFKLFLTQKLVIGQHILCAFKLKLFLGHSNVKSWLHVPLT